MSAPDLGIHGASLSVRDVLGPGAYASEVHSAWEHRPEQLEMAEAIAEKLATGGVLAVEAPTGVGKTMAYLVPALLSLRKVIVSTNTKTLQSQLVEKDLPLLGAVLARAGIRLRRAGEEDGPPAPNERRYALMKGRNNYLCLDRLDRRFRQRSFAFAPEDARIAQIASWAKESETGDRSELDDLPEDWPVWGELDARTEICSGSRCARYSDCFIVRMRRRAQAADLIIINHHLLLADLALRLSAEMTGARSFGEVIPPADALIVDEAHTLEDTAAQYFGGEVSRTKLNHLVHDLDRFLEERTISIGTLPSAIESAVAAIEAVFSALPRDDESRRRIPLAPEQESPAPNVFDAAREKLPLAEAALDALIGAIESNGKDAVADGLLGRIQTLRLQLGFALRAQDPDYVYWSEHIGGRARIGAAPIEVAELFRRTLFAAYGAVVLTSATLATGRQEGLRYFLSRIGAPSDTETRVLGSPFDYPSQAALFLPRDVPMPDSPGYAEALVDWGGTLIERLGGGAFFLFTSHRMMRRVADQLGPQLPYPVLRQGDAPKPVLIRRFIERAPAVLFATASFWEGVDVPGDPLRLVLIDRLPFASPADPLIEARLEQLERKGRSAFAHYQMPQAILRLKQAFGRLVRTRYDRGVVAILDSRIHRRAYGGRFLASLPPATHLSSVEALDAWLVGAPSPRD